MGIKQGELLKLNAFSELKDKVNILMQKRKFGDRPLNGQIASISSTSKPSYKDANSIYNPYAYMGSKDGTYPTQIKAGDKLEASKFDIELSDIIKYSDFNVYHNNYSSSPISAGCGGQCAGLCVSRCSNGCKSSCSSGCSEQCIGYCEAACTKGCIGCTGCSSNCAQSCEDACTGCGDSCKGNESDSCGQCVRQCGASACQYQCTGNGCAGFCANRCEGECQTSCGGLCSGYCTGQLSQGNWEISLPQNLYNHIEHFTESTTWTVPSGVKSIYLFAVGGGGGASQVSYIPQEDTMTAWAIKGYAGGAGGGFTHRAVISVNPGDIITILIGAGGSAGVNGWAGSSKGFKSAWVDGANGGTTIVMKNSSICLVALGGNTSDWLYPRDLETTYGSNGNGGSGGCEINGGYEHFVPGSNGNDANFGKSTKGKGQKSLAIQTTTINNVSYTASEQTNTTCPLDKIPYGAGGNRGERVRAREDYYTRYFWTSTGGNYGGGAGGINGYTNTSSRSMLGKYTWSFADQCGLDGTGGGGGGGGGYYYIDDSEGGRRKAQSSTESGDGGCGIVILGCNIEKAQGYCTLSASTVSMNENFLTTSISITSSHGGIVEVSCSNSNVEAVLIGNTINLYAMKAGTTDIYVTCNQTLSHTACTTKCTVTVTCNTKVNISATYRDWRWSESEEWWVYTDYVYTFRDVDQLLWGGIGSRPGLNSVLKTQTYSEQPDSYYYGRLAIINGKLYIGRSDFVKYDSRWKLTNPNCDEYWSYNLPTAHSGGATKYTKISTSLWFEGEKKQ